MSNGNVSDRELAARIAARELEQFTSAYIECALWSSTDDDDNPLDENYSDADLAPATLATMRTECADFVASVATLLELACLAENSYGRQFYSMSRAGHDFWLTRNHHGVGFWDRGLGELGQELTTAAQFHGSCDLYVGDDGKLYV